jgi:hypothetical protein
MQIKSKDKHIKRKIQEKQQKIAKKIIKLFYKFPNWVAPLKLQQKATGKDSSN